jgi:adenylate cyclase
VKIGIKVRLAVVLSCMGLLTTVAMGAVMISHQKNSLEEQFRSMAGTITGELAGDSKIPLMQKDTLAMHLLVESMLDYPGIYDAYVLGDNFIIEGHMNPQQVGVKYFDHRQLSIVSGARPPWRVREDGGIITLAYPIIFKGTTVGYTVVSFSDEFIQESISGAITSAVIITMVAVVIVGLLSIPLAGGLLRPVFRLIKATREISLGNLDYRVPEKGESEISDLVRSFNDMATDLKKKEVLKGVFNRYVSPHVADEIMKDPERIILGGDRRDVTVLFADIRGFTPLTSKLLPEVTVEILNRYFTLTTEIIFRFEGTVDKFIGDAVMCVFGSPIRSEIHIEQAIKAAVAIRQATGVLNDRRHLRGLTPLYMGLGIDSGEVIVGNMGSQMRMEFTAIGEAVNMASRLTDIARAGEVLLTDAVFARVNGNVDVERLPDMHIKGIESPSAIYRVEGLKGGWKEEVDGVVEDVLAEAERLDVV